MVFGVLAIAFALAAGTYPALNYILRMLMNGRKLKGFPVLPNRHMEIDCMEKDFGPQWYGKKGECRKLYVKWRGFIPILVVCHPDPIRAIVGVKGVQEKADYYGLTESWAGAGLIIAGGKKWARNRKMLNPTFHINILKTYVEVYNESVDVFIDKLFEGCDQDCMEIHHPVRLLTLDVLLCCALSYQGQAQLGGANHEYVEAATSLANLYIKRMNNPLLYSDLIYALTSDGKEWKRKCNTVHRFSERFINERIQSLENNPSLLNRKKRLDFLDMLLTVRDAEGVGLTRREIRDEVDVFMFAGTDTSSSAITWTLYSLAKHPQCQKRCQEEVDALLKGRTSTEIRWEDLSQMPYLQMCIKECLRMYSVVPTIGRKALAIPTVVDGVTLPKGLTILIDIFQLHHNPTVWGDDHMEYKPERFLPEKLKDIDPFAFMPFSTGPRNCIGQNFAMNEMKVVLARILHQFQFDVDENRIPRMKQSITMESKDGVHLKVSRRYPIV